MDCFFGPETTQKGRARDTSRLLYLHHCANGLHDDDKLLYDRTIASRFSTVPELRQKVQQDHKDFDNWNILKCNIEAFEYQVHHINPHNTNAHTHN